MSDYLMVVRLLDRPLVLLILLVGGRILLLIGALSTDSSGTAILLYFVGRGLFYEVRSSKGCD